MKSSFVAFAAISIVLALRITPIPADADTADVIESKLFREDVEQLIRVVDEVHPNPYYYVSREQADEARRTLWSSIENPLTRTEFYSSLGRFTSTFEDGHLAVVPPADEFREHLDAGERVFPFEIEYVSGHVRVAETYDDDGTIEVGDQLVSINGHTADSLFATFVREQSGEPRYRSVRARHAFRLLLWIYGIHAPYTLDWLDSRDGQPRTAQLDGATRATIAEKREASSGQSAHYRFVVLDDQIGLIEFRSMQDEKAFAVFLEETFTRCQAESIIGLIVDLRRNGGGNSRLGDALLAYITGKPYRMAARKEWKVSQSYKDYLRASGTQANRYVESAVGDTLVYEAKVKSAPDNPLRFEKPVCFLIGAETYSSAVMLANAVGDFDLATLIGEETGGRPNSFGETLRFTLAHSRLRVDVSSATWIRANGDTADKRGVMPDITVPGGLTGHGDGDLAVARAREWILTHPAGIAR